MKTPSFQMDSFLESREGGLLALPGMHLLSPQSPHYKRLKIHRNTEQGRESSPHNREGSTLGLSCESGSLVTRVPFFFSPIRTNEAQEILSK